MNTKKIVGLAAAVFLYLSAFAQTTSESDAPAIYENTIGGHLRSLRTGIFSNRTTNGVNNYTNPKTWTYWPMVSGWNTRFYGGKTSTVGSMTSGSNVVTTSSSFFASSDVNKTIEVIGAGVSGTKLVATVTGFTSATSVSVSVSASTTVTNVIVHVGDATKPAYTEGHYTIDGYANFQNNYRLLFPVNYNPNENYKYPMIVMLHGAGERGDCWNSSCFSSLGVVTKTNAGTIATGSNILNSSVSTFTSNDVKKVIQVTGAGYPSFPDLYIAAVNSSTQVVLSAVAPVGVTNRTFSYGYQSDNQYRNGDYNLTHGGQVHLEAIYNPTTGSNGKKAEDPTLPSRAFPGFIVFPQNQNGWLGDSQYEQVYRIIELLIQAYNIDPDRIYMHGLSNGGEGVWHVTSQRPDLITAILPMSATISPGDPMFNTPSGNNPDQGVNRLRTIPAWVFQGGVDTSPSPNNTNQLVAKVKGAGGSPRYTIYPTTGHGTWGAAYAEPDFFTWMLKKTKRDIQIMFGDSTLCATDNSGVTLALGTGFLAYQWELDGNVIAGATGSAYNATVAGKYRARFSRISATPSEAQWNAWSKPVVIKETPAVTPTLTAVGTSHLPDINGGTMVRINGPTTSFLTKNWYVNGVLNTTNTNFPLNNNLDTASYTLRTTAGRVSLKTIPLNSCSSLESNSIYVTTNTPVTMVAPASPSAKAITPSSIQLFWTDNTPDETNFEVYRSTTGAAGSYNFFALLPQGSISYTDTGLVPNTTYYYQIRAVNNTSVSPYTSNIVVSTQSDSQVPSAPQNLSLVSKTVSSVKLSWTASTDNNGVTNYLIYVNGGNNPISVGSNATTYNVTSLNPNSNYAFTVAAVDAGGNQSQQSNQLLVSTTFSGLNYTYSSVNVNLLTDAGNNWTTPEVTGTVTNFDLTPRRQDTFFNFKFEGYITLPAGTYNFQTTSDDGSAIYIGAENSTAFPFNPGSPSTNQIYNNDGLHGCTNNSSYTLQNIQFTGGFRPITVIMFQQQGGFCLNVQVKLSSSGSWSNVAQSSLTSGSAPLLTPPSVPQNLSATTNSMTAINLTWDPIAITNYEVYRSTDNVNYAIVARTAVNNFTDSSLNPGTLYYYKLKAVNGNGSSAFSSVANATTQSDSQAPTVPQGLSIISSNYTNASFQWNASTDNVNVAGYKIYANGTLLGNSPVTTYYTTSLLPGTAYNITVSAYDVSGNESLQSSQVSFSTSAPQTFYSVGSDLSQLTSWNTASDGSGTTPPSFNYNGQYFVVQSNQTLGTTLTIGGNVSRVIVSDNVTLNLNQPLTATLRVGNNSTVNVNVDYQPSFETVSPSSTVRYNTYSAVSVANYGNLVLNGSGLKTFGSGTVQVQGNMTVATGLGLKGAPSNATTISVGGDLNLGTTLIQPASDNRVVLQFPTGTHNVNCSSDQFFSKVTTASGAVVNFNTSGKTINLGSPNGGGIDLANGSTLVVGNNNLNITDQGSVNPNNTTGEISINNTNIQITTTSNSGANFYFATGNNTVSGFTMQETGTGTIQIRKPVQITDKLKINGGTLTANGNVTLKSTATATASIQQIVNGNIVGNVSVERYVDPKRVYRYVSSPVSGVKVSDWQNYFPVTGTFSGASTGSGLSSNPSLYYYSEPNYIAYPVASNTELIQPGRGYAAFLRDGVNPTTLVQTGNPNQGNFNFTLTGGTGQPQNGWNLLGNPYASDIVWSNTGWTSSGIGNVVSVRENKADGSVIWRIWDRSTNTGNLPNGQIPAGQAFWVQAAVASPTLTVTEAAKTTLSSTSNINYFRTDVPNNLLTVSLNNGVNKDYAYIKLVDGGTDAYEALTDGFKNRNSFFNVSTSSTDGVDLVVNELSNSFCDKSVPLTLATISTGNYTLQFDNLDNFVMAKVQLLDAFTSSTVDLNSSNSQYSFAVTSDPSSFTNRFTLKMSRPTLITNNLVAAAKNTICENDQSTVIEVRNSQTGVEYQAINSTGGIISDKQVGTGESIYLTIPTKALSNNSNLVRINAGYAGCSVQTLANTTTVSVASLPTLTGDNTVNGCLGSALDITASGTGAQYEWTNRSSGEVLSETGNTLRISVNNRFMNYRVVSVGPTGCKSMPKDINVQADSLNVPEIKMDGGLLTTSPALNIQWYWNDTPIQAANQMTFEPTKSGSYKATTQNYFCTRTSAPYLVTAIEDGTNHAMMLSVYPNPSETGLVNVKGTSKDTESLYFMVTDIIGKEILNSTITANDFTTGFELNQKLAPGVYIFKVTQNKNAVYQKVIVR